jgi:hypothetical protein
LSSSEQELLHSQSFIFPNCSSDDPSKIRSLVLDKLLHVGVIVKLDALSYAANTLTFVDSLAIYQLIIVHCHRVSPTINKIVHFACKGVDFETIFQNVDACLNLLDISVLLLHEFLSLISLCRNLTKNEVRGNLQFLCNMNYFLIELLS